MSKTRPDAVIIPRGFMAGTNDDQRKESIVEVAERLLECESLELAWCHDQVSYFFCTRRAEDTEMFPVTHRQAGQPRYRWIKRDDGLKVGYLVSEEA